MDRRAVRMQKEEDRRLVSEQVARKPEPPAEVPATEPPSLNASNVLSLQGALGNRAVTAMLARNGGGTTAPPAPAPAGGAAPAPPTAPDKAQLDKDWEAAVKGPNWEAAVDLGHTLDNVDLVAKLDKLDFEQVSKFCNQANLMMPWAFFIRLLAETVRIKKLDELYIAAVNGAKWDKAVVLLDAYLDASVLPKARLIKAKGDAALTAAATEAAKVYSSDNHRVRRTLSFLEVENLTGSAVRPIGASGVTGSTSEAAVKVPETGGSVTYSSGGTAGSNKNVYGLTYTGDDAQDTGWIQFIARNIEKLDDKDASLGFHVGNWTPSGQSARAFSTSAAPGYYLDTLSNQAPFYEASSSGAGGGQGLSDIEAKKTAMYDAPSGRVDIVAPLFTDAKVKKVKSRAVFDTYLVKQMQVLRHEQITVEYTFTPAQAAAGSDTTPTTTHSGGGKTDSLPSDRYKAMTARFPKFAYLPHS
jgi:hypothetical protein